MNSFPKRLIINCPGRAGRLATFYCSTRLHIINPTSQWNCPGNAPLNYRVWLLVYKALSYHFQWVLATPSPGSPHPLRGSWKHKRGRTVQIQLQRSPSTYLAKGPQTLVWRRAGGIWAISPEHRNSRAAISGIPFMEDQDGKQRG